MEPFPVVEQLDVPENGLPHVFDVLEVSPVGQRKSLLDLYFCASVMPDHKQACVGRDTRLFDFCHCFTFLGLRNEYSSLCYPLIKLLHGPFLPRRFLVLPKGNFVAGVSW